MVVRLIPAAGYLRMSTDMQDQSIPQQREAILAYAAKHGYRIVRWYADEGISGDKTEKRAGFLQMREDAISPARPFAVVICWDQSRFGRFDQIEAGYWIKPLRDAGVSLVTVDAGPVDWESSVGQLIYGVNQMGKHEFLRDHSKNTTRGALASARRGEWHGLPPLGYRVGADRRLVPGPDEEIALVREAFDRYVNQGDSLREIATDWNARGIKTARCRPECAPKRPTRKVRKATVWGNNQIREMLRKPAYVGDVVWNRRARGKYHGVAGGEVAPRRRTDGIRENSPDQWIVTADAHPALIDRETFRRAAERLKENKTRTTPGCEARGEVDFLFTGKVVCGNCGSRMHGRYCRERRNGTPAYIKYVCGGGNKHGRKVCRVRSIREDYLVDLCVLCIDLELFRDFDEQTWRRDIEAKLRERAAFDPAELGRLRQAVADLAAKIQQGTERYLTCPAHMTADVAQMVEAWRREHAEAAERLKEREQAGLPEALLAETARHAAWALASMRSVLYLDDREAVRRLLGRVVEKATVHFEDVPVKTLTRSQPYDLTLKAKPDAFIVRNLLPDLALKLEKQAAAPSPDTDLGNPGFRLSASRNSRRWGSRDRSPAQNGTTRAASWWQ
jgi:DNA invertase Pin-like site-specific DNA recombinase